MISTASAAQPAGTLAWRRVGVLVPVLSVAVAMRLWGLGQAPLWMDEASTAAFAALPWEGLLHGIGRLEPNPPAFYALEKLWTGLAGDSDLVLRLPSVLFGLGGVAAVTLLAQAAFGRRAALWTGLLIATQAQHLDHSREARVYALLFLAVALAALAARRIATWSGIDPLWRPAAALAMLSATAMSLHNTGPVAAFCVFVYAGVTALRWPGARRPRLMTLVAAGVGALALAAPTLLAALRMAADQSNNAAWIPVPDWVISTQVALAVFAVPLSGIRYLPAPLLLGGFALGAVIVAAALVPAARRARRSPDTAGMLAAVVAALLLLHGLSQFVPMLIERTLLFSLVFFLPLFGAALAGFTVPARAVVLGMLLSVQGPALLKALGPTRHGEDWAGLASGLQQRAAATAWPVVVLGGFEAVAIDRYLPPNDRARPALSITPDIGAELSDEVARRMTAALPIRQGSDAAALCAALGRRDGVLLVLRQSAILPAMQPVVEALMIGAGGTPGETTRYGSLAVQPWRGVCAGS